MTRHRIRCHARIVGEGADDTDATRRVVQQTVKPVVGNLGIRLQYDDVAIAMQPDATIDRRSDALACRQANDGCTAGDFEFAQERLDRRISRGIVDQHQLIRCATLRCVHALDAAAQCREATVNRDDDIDRGHQRWSPSRRRAAANG